jgi:hypothetical protein
LIANVVHLYYKRRIATDKVRKKEYIVDPEILEIEHKLQETLGTRVHVEKRDIGGSVTIDFFSNDDLRTIVSLMETGQIQDGAKINMMARFEEKNGLQQPIATEAPNEMPADDRSREEIKQAEEDSDLYNIKNFSL